MRPRFLSSPIRPRIAPHTSLLFSPEVENMATENQRGLAVANAKYASTFSEQTRQLLPPPAKKYILVTCMDTRIDPSAAFGIQPGDAHVLRNAGGSAKEALRSILISQHFMGTAEVILVKHTGCGMMMFDNVEAHNMVEYQQGKESIDEAFEFHTFSDVEVNLKDEVAWLQSHPAIVRGTDVSGWIYDVESGKVRQVV